LSKQRFAHNHQVPVGRLSPEEYQSLNTHFEVVQVASRDAAFKRHREFRFVCFPISCAMSILTPLSNDIRVEVAPLSMKDLLAAIFLSVAA
jgi:hypothetical protein